MSGSRSSASTNLLIDAAVSRTSRKRVLELRSDSVRRSRHVSHRVGRPLRARDESLVSVRCVASS